VTTLWPVTPVRHGGGVPGQLSSRRDDRSRLRPVPRSSRPVVDVAAEEAFLSSLLSGVSVARTSGEISPLDVVRPDHFADLVLCKIYEAISRSATETGVVDPTGVRADLIAKGENEAVTKLVDLMASVPSGDPSRYAQRVIDGTFRRLCRTAVSEIAELVDNSDCSSEELLRRMDLVYERVAAGRYQTSTAASVYDAKSIYMEALADAQAGIAGVPTGFAQLDEITHGLLPRTMTVVGGVTGMGKTTFALAVIENALRAGHPVVWVAAEGSLGTIAHRLNELFTRDDAADSLREYPALFVYSQEWPSISREVRFAARRWRQGTPSLAPIDATPLLIVDHIHAMRAADHDKSRSPGSVLLENVFALRHLAQSENIALLLCAQLQERDVNMRRDRRPSAADIIGRGPVQQAADLVVLPFRPAAYDAAAPAEQATIIVGKNRRGVLGDLPITWDPEQVIFRDGSSLPPGAF